jgi:hypothetical protein
MRGDRHGTSKQHGGGLCIYVKELWCKSAFLKNSYCDDNVELLTISCRPFYMPREFNNIYVTVAYVPPSGNFTAATEVLVDSVNYMEENCPTGINILMGDFNGCDVADHIPNYHQYVNCPTREDRTLDLLFCNVKDAYRVLRRPPLGNSDHNMLYCLPSYVQKLKSQTSKTICVRKWSDECINTLKSCFDCTVWEELYDDGCELDQNVDVCCSYIQFCTDVIVPRKAVTVFPNNKPWITKDVKEVINKKKRALSGDRTNLKEIQKELNCKISDAKLVYKDKVEGLFKSSRSREAWKGLKYLCGCTTKNCMPEPDDVNVYVDELNNFYARFDVGDFKSECDEVLNIVNNKASTRIIMSDDDVVKALNTAKPGKASGPDKVCARVVKNCRYELVKPMRYLFQASLDNCEVPSMWKTSEIVPVPKVKIPQVKNDLRPVALTSVLMKCLESFVKKYLCKQVQHVCDKLQFAYRARRSVDDAVITLLDSVCSHLDKSRTYSRILFIDFSSAFNTIKPHIMIRKLYDMNVNCNLIKWIFSYLTLRPQYVKLGHVRSNSIVTNTGAPQGCVLSPLLFTLYTNDCTSSFNNCIILKYADDTVIIGNIFDNDTSSYKSQVESFVKWCDSNFLDLNVRKTKEMIMDFRKDNNDHDALCCLRAKRRNNKAIKKFQSALRASKEFILRNTSVIS